VITGSLVVVGVCLASLTMISGQQDLWQMRATLLLMGLCFPMSFQPSQVMAFATIPAASTGRASTLYSAERQVAGAAGVALLATVLSLGGTVVTRTGAVAPDGTAFHVAYAVTAVLALLGAVVGLTIDDAAAWTTTKVRNATAAPAIEQLSEAAPPVR
jgi:hypothetical protein